MATIHFRHLNRKAGISGERKRPSLGKHFQPTRSHQYDLATHSDPNPAVAAACRDADSGWPTDEPALPQLSVLIVAELVVSMKIGGNATCGAARRRVLHDTVIVPVPPLLGVGVEQVGVFRADFG